MQFGVWLAQQKVIDSSAPLLQLILRIFPWLQHLLSVGMMFCEFCYLPTTTWLLLSGPPSAFRYHVSLATEASVMQPIPPDVRISHDVPHVSTGGCYFEELST